MKNKVNISKWNFYLQLVVVIFFITFITIHMASDLSNNTVNASARALESGLKKGTNKYDEFINEVVNQTIKIWMIQYLSASIFTILFVIYGLYAINKVEVGYIYSTIWLVVWFAFAFAPLILWKKFDWYDAVNLILFIAILISIFFVVKDLQTQKKQSNLIKIKNQIKNI